MTTYILRPVTRVPTLTELAHAFSYIEGEFVIQEGIVRADMWIEGLAWGGSHEIDEGDMLVAKEALPQLAPEVWVDFAASADSLRAQRGIGPIFRQGVQRESTSGGSMITDARSPSLLDGGVGCGANVPAVALW